jgi:hypothetical protein
MSRIQDWVDVFVTHGLVIRVYENNLVVLVDTILVDPVRVQDPQVPAPLANTLLCCAPETALELQVVDTLANGFAISGTCVMQRIECGISPRWIKLTLGHRFFAVTPPDTDTVDNVALLRFVAKTTGLVRTGRTGRAMDNIQLPVFPTPIPCAINNLSDASKYPSPHTEHGGGSGGHPTVSSCKALRCTCTRPSCTLEILTMSAVCHPSCLPAIHYFPLD